MKICILPRKIQEVVEDLVERVSKSKDSTALLAVDEEEALVVMTWAKYEELLKAASAPSTHTKEVIREPYSPYSPWRYWYPYTTASASSIVYTGSTAHSILPWSTAVTSNTVTTLADTGVSTGTYSIYNSSDSALWLDANE